MSKQLSLPTPKAALVLEGTLAHANSLCDSWQAIRDNARVTGDKALESDADARILECREQAMRVLRLLRGLDLNGNPPEPDTPRAKSTKRTKQAEGEQCLKAPR